MSLNYNKAILAGRICNDPEIKQTQSGLSVCNFRLAVNRKVKPEEHPEADFFDVTAWRSTADFIARYFNKGSAICVTGSIHNKRWQDSQGNNRISTEIVAENVDFVESKSERNGQDPLSHGQPAAYNPYIPASSPSPDSPTFGPTSTPQYDQASIGDDLPF